MSHTEERAQPKRARQGRGGPAYRVQRRSKRGWAHGIVTSIRLKGKKNPQGWWVQSIGRYCRVEDWVGAREEEAAGERAAAAHLGRSLEAVARIWGTTPEALEQEEVAGVTALARIKIARLRARADQIDAEVAVVRRLGRVRPCPCGGVPPRLKPPRPRDEAWLFKMLRQVAREKLAEQQERLRLETEPSLRADLEVLGGVERIREGFCIMLDGTKTFLQL